MKYKEVYIIDFFDSFTYNIANFYYSLNIPVEVISYQKLTEYMGLLEGHQKKVLIWGPGPKHPLEYESIFSCIQKLRTCSQIFHMGICLGHQILSILDGFEVMASSEIIHGQKEKIKIPNWENFFQKSDFGREVFVQRYNSLAPRSVKKSLRHVYSSEYNEIMISQYKNGISYQFHPESVGTSFPSLFFQPSLNFLYNVLDEREPQSSWHI